MRKTKSKKSKRHTTRKHSNSKPWRTAITTAMQKYKKTHSLSKARLAAKQQILSNIHHLFGTKNERLYV